ncbi:MAG: SufE family protein [Parachlamydiaceae bacterium]
MAQNLDEKIDAIKGLFSSCKSNEDKYKKIIELGRALPPIPEKFKTDENLVKGCQSRMYLHSVYENGVLSFEAESDALISAGLAALLVQVYSGETPETILKSPPLYLEELAISQSLTPSRSNGLYSLHLRIKQEALKALFQKA